MTVLDGIIAGVRADLADRRLSLSQIHDMVESATPVRDALAALRDYLPNNLRFIC